MGRRHGRRRHYRAVSCPAVTGCARRPDAVREQLRITARSRAVRAAQHYADLLVAEAAIAARLVYPTVGRLVFRLSNDVFGAAATLVAAYRGDGQQLWHMNTGDEWPDESLVTDHLAAAADALDGYFPSVNAADTTHDGDELYAIDLRPATSTT